MSISATPGSTVAATLQLPANATTTVKWQVTDPVGDTVAEGQQPPTGTLVVISFAMPRDAVVPLDGSEYRVTATDGTTSVAEGIALVSALDPSYDHADEIAYVKGKNFVCRLITTEPADAITVSVSLHDGTVLASSVAVPAWNPTRLGNAYVYTADLGVLNTHTDSTFGSGSVLWDYVTESATTSDQQLHAFWTITPYSSTFIHAIRKLVDRARIGDANRYLNITMADLANALLRGMDYVINSAPMLTPFALDQMPITLMDYIVKAAAVDLLRAQYLAEGMSSFDMQGLGVQLNVDRSQYLDGLAQQLTTDLQNLPASKRAWQQQGMPLGGTLIPGSRPIGILAISVGTYNNYSVAPYVSPLSSGRGYSFFRNFWG